MHRKTKINQRKNALHQYTPEKKKAYACSCSYTHIQIIVEKYANVIKSKCNSYTSRYSSRDGICPVINDQFEIVKNFLNVICFVKSSFNIYYFRYTGICTFQS